RGQGVRIGADVDLRQPAVLDDAGVITPHPRTGEGVFGGAGELGQVRGSGRAWRGRVLEQVGVAAGAVMALRPGQGEHHVDDEGAVERKRGAAAAGDYGRGGVVDVLPPRSDVLGHLLGDDLACDRVSERLLGALGGGASVDVEGEQGGAGGGPSGPRFGFGGGGHFCSWVWRICSVRAWATAG